MYLMKNIISYDYEIPLPKCMYHMKNPYDFELHSIENDINICDQVIKLIKKPRDKMTELEHRQDELLKKLDILYDRIKTISSICAPGQLSDSNKNKTPSVFLPEEIVLNVNPDSLPWYLFVFLKDSSIEANITWHIHSSVTNEKVQKIQAFLRHFKITNSSSRINLRLIFKSGFNDSELKFSSLAVPILGSVNILRYLSLVYPNTVPYDINDFYVDGLLDVCYLLEKTSEKTKDALIQKLFVQCKDWIYNNQFSIVDVAAFNVIKQMRNKPKSVPNTWFEKCQQKCSL